MNSAYISSRFIWRYFSRSELHVQIDHAAAASADNNERVVGFTCRSSEMLKCPNPLRHSFHSLNQENYRNDAGFRPPLPFLRTPRAFARRYHTRQFVVQTTARLAAMGILPWFRNSPDDWIWYLA